MASQAVSAADASSPATLVVPAGQATQVFALTASFAAQGGIASGIGNGGIITGRIGGPRWTGDAGVCADRFIGRAEGGITGGIVR